MIPALTSFATTTASAYRSASVDVLAQIGDVDPTPPPGADKFNTLLSWVMWGAIIFCIAGLIIGAVALAYERSQGTGGEGKQKIIGAMIGAVIIGIAAGLVNSLVL